LFEAGKTPSFTTDLSGPKEIEDLIEREWKARETEASYLENGLFFCLSHIANSFIRSDAKNLRVIVISDTPSNPRDEEKARALIELVEKFHYFPAFIDIIRIGNEKFYPDDVKLRIITATANGGLFYVENEKELRDTLVQGLVKRKTLETLTPLGGNRFIEPEHHSFFANMASNLITPPQGMVKPCDLCKGDICPFCGDSQDAPFLCPGCGIAFHDCCAARYSIQNNIGIKYIFRCPNCTMLLKVDPESVINVGAEQVTSSSFQEDYDKDLLQEIISEEDKQAKESGVEEPSPTANLPNITNTPELASSRVPSGPRLAPIGTGFFKPRGFIKPTGPPQTTINNVQKEVWTPPADSTSSSQGIKTPAKPPPLEPTRRLQTRVLVCRICGHNLPQRAARCPNCGGIVSQN